VLLNNNIYHLLETVYVFCVYIDIARRRNIPAHALEKGMNIISFCNESLVVD
jgi:hypothetical protein